MGLFDFFRNFADHVSGWGAFVGIRPSTPAPDTAADTYRKDATETEVMQNLTLQKLGARRQEAENLANAALTHISLVTKPTPIPFTVEEYIAFQAFAAAQGWRGEIAWWIPAGIVTQDLTRKTVSEAMGDLRFDMETLGGECMQKIDALFRVPSGYWMLWCPAPLVKRDYHFRGQLRNHGITSEIRHPQPNELPWLVASATQLNGNAFRQEWMSKTIMSCRETSASIDDLFILNFEDDQLRLKEAPGGAGYGRYHMGAEPRTPLTPFDMTPVVVMSDKPAPTDQG